MGLWERDKRVLAAGLVASMELIYRDMDGRTFKELLSPAAWLAALQDR